MSEGEARRPGRTLLKLSAERLTVGRRRTDTGRVRVRVRTRERPAEVDEVLSHEDVTVTRVPVGRPVAATPPVRETEGTMIIPVVEEVLVVERRLMLKEEIHVKRVQSSKHHHETVTLREQVATVERVPLQEEPSESPDVAALRSREDLP